MNRLMHQHRGERQVIRLAKEIHIDFWSPTVTQSRHGLRREMIECLGLHQLETFLVVEDKDDRLAPEDILPLLEKEDVREPVVHVIKFTRPAGGIATGHVGIEEKIFCFHGNDVEPDATEDVCRIRPHGKNRGILFGRR